MNSTALYWSLLWSLLMITFGEIAFICFVAAIINEWPPWLGWTTIGGSSTLAVASAVLADRRT